MMNSSSWLPSGTVSFQVPFVTWPWPLAQRHPKRDKNTFSTNPSHSSTAILLTSSKVVGSRPLLNECCTSISVSKTQIPICCRLGGNSNSQTTWFHRLTVKVGFNGCWIQVCSDWIRWSFLSNSESDLGITRKTETLERSSLNEWTLEHWFDGQYIALPIFSWASSGHASSPAKVKLESSGLAL